MNSIMKVCAYFFSILALIFSTQAMSYDAVFNVTGAVRAGTCKLTSYVAYDIFLGDHLIGANGFGNSKGSKTKEVEWVMSFDCPENSGVYIRPRGNTYSSSEDTILSLDYISGSTSAKGLGIETSYSKNRTSWYAMRLYSNITVHGRFEPAGSTTMYFRSVYKQMDATITPGIANATLNIDVTYE
ncbi:MULTISPECIES: fimbrial protein [Providencia]|uniref:Fimbrial-type adhesion domain-containing protein n=1 Tax=Providencia heimbachae ATCC 35613 TaxID=1354272 RepID=A0A1B7JMJ5_9GAMM|nr:fimbrial protein [Providencia heimbachae]MBP6122077.1 fimbrial protein [Providencia sp.]NIH21730.1 fimbrial protein [Providencia heimbachae]OAT49146.1 hypothetical protein M998_3122 [Providencia heimbachae ATCC 35613]QCJ69270.1 hypothetical protein C9446_04965 [Providencia heimbachae]SQH12344.1 P pilus assembly protein, pilin FimA [Providencia heimbachae]